jgi:nicotinamidase-related amidase
LWCSAVLVTPALDRYTGPGTTTLQAGTMMNAIDAQASSLVLIDYQARLMPAIHGADELVAKALLLARAARLLGVPVLATEHNPERLGPTTGALAGMCGQTVAKTHFDACEDGLLTALQPQATSRRQVVIAGCEAHVCMLQSALGLLRAGHDVFVVENASGSRRPADHAAAMRRLAQAGAAIVTHEMVLFEWLHDCRHPRFREVLALVKAEP